MTIAQSSAPSKDTQNRLVALMLRLAPADGVFDQAFAGLRVVRASEPQPPRGAIYTPSLCVVAQGSKMATLGEKTFLYHPGQFLVLAMPVPVKAQILEATPEKPFLSLVLDMPPAQVTEMMLEMDAEEPTQELPPAAPSAIAVSRMHERLAAALLRFLEALEDPAERKVLAPMAAREIVYHVLAGEQGNLLRAASLRDSAAQRVARVIRFLEKNLDQELDVPSLAKASAMSSSALHHNFKAVTSISPMQYLKQLRLHRARVLMLNEGCGAAEAAHRVGYGSASQFSREFRRLFGETPKGEVHRMRSALGTLPLAEATA